MVGIAGGAAPISGRTVEFDRARVLSADIVQVRDIVVGFRRQQWHVVALAVGAGIPVGFQSAWKIVEVNIGK